MSAHILVFVSTKLVEYIARRPEGVFCRPILSRSYWCFWPGGTAWSSFVLRLGPSSCFLLLVMVERVYSACDRMTCCEFVWRVEVAIPCVLALTTCCLTRNPSAIVWPLVVGGASGVAILSRSCLMVWTTWLHYFFKLGLTTHHLWEIDVSWSYRRLLSRPLRGIRGLGLILTARWLVLHLALGTSSSKHLDNRELTELKMNVCW